MGLFSKEVCAVCGKEVRLSKTKLADGNHICGNCSDAIYYRYGFLESISAQTNVDVKTLTLPQVLGYYELRKQNYEELKGFKCTVPLGPNILVDQATNEIVFFDYFSYTANKLLEKNPPIFKMENLAFLHLTFSDTESSQTITGKAVAESTAYLVFGFADPVFEVFKVEIGELKAKSGIFTNKVKGGDEIQDIYATISGMRFNAINDANARNVLIPANNMEAFWALLGKAYRAGYVGYMDVDNYLRQYCGGDKNLIRDVRARHGF